MKPIYKKIVAPVLLVAGLTFFSSCKKFLDQQPVAAASEASVFSNPNTVLQALLGVYNRMAGDNAFGTNLSAVYPFDTDEMIGYSAGAVTDAQRAFNAYALDKGNANLAPTFIRLYQGVERANICIYNIPKMPMYTTGTDAQKRDLLRLHGEALALRALFYFELVKLWGDVPATYDPAIQLTNFDIPKTNRDSIYDHIIEDLRVAAEMVPWRGENGAGSDERITKGGVKALRARIALFRGGYSLRRESKLMERTADYQKYYTIAMNECSDIMAMSSIHKLNPSFQAVWQDGLLALGKIEANGEVLFEVAMGGETIDSDSKLGAWSSIRVTSGSTTYGNNRNYILPTMFYAFSPYDKRRDVTAAPFNITNNNYVGASIAGISDGKWRRDWVTPAVAFNTGKGFYGMNWPIIRYSDVLLMYAETVNELSGPTAAAIDAVNTVRRRSWSVNAIKGVTINSGGTGYTTIPTVTISGGGGTGAVARARITSGAVTAIDIVNIGSGYTSTPTIALTGGGGTGFSGTVTLTSITDANLTAAQTADKPSFLAAIQNERLLEFGSEGIRKYDLIRWNILGAKLTETKAELAKMLAKTAPYNTLPLSMYYLQNSTGGIVWGNSFYAPAPTAPTGYTAVGWLSSVTTALTDKFAASFTPNKNELLPIPQTVIEASHGSITQDYGY